MKDIHRLGVGLTLFACISGSVTANPITKLGPPADIQFTALQDGTEQHYVIQLPQQFDASKPHDLLIALHGHGSDRWQFVNNSRGECQAARDAAAKHQMIYVSPDYRATTSWMGPTAVSDLVQIMDELNQEYRIENVVICGGSMGGTSAIAFAVMHPELVDGVVSLNGTANMLEYAGFADAIVASYGGTKSEKPQVYRERSAELFPERLTMPVSLTTGGQDTLVPPDSGLRLADLLIERKSPVRLIHRPEGGHETSYADSLEALEYVIEKCDQSLAPSKSLLRTDGTPQTVVCLGDSVTGVYYHTGGQRAYPEMLEIGLRQRWPQSSVKVINAGISGQTTREGLERLDRDVLSKNPDLVTISFGLNDLVRVDPEAFRANLVQIIKQCRERNSQVVLCTPNAVIDTESRPIGKLNIYCDIIRTVGRDLAIPVCDQNQSGNRLRQRAPWTWRLSLSDEIHPNMDGHKRMAEELYRTITGEAISLDTVTPPSPRLPHTKALVKQGRAVRVLAMPPYDAVISSAIKAVGDAAAVTVTTWPVDGKSMLELEQDAKNLVRPLRPDLVVIAIPRSAKAESDEQFVHGYSWIMNWSLSFGQQEWDCVVVHPSVADPSETEPRDELSRQLVRAQHLELIDRDLKNDSSMKELFSNWFLKQFEN